MAQDIDEVLEKLARDVESAVHALYRGEMRQATAKARTDHLVQDAKSALAAISGGEDAPLPTAPVPRDPDFRFPAPVRIGAVHLRRIGRLDK